MYVGFRVAIIGTVITGYESISYIGSIRPHDLLLPVTKCHWVLSLLKVYQRPLPVLVLSQAVKRLMV